jgi:hypothetical protein
VENLKFSGDPGVDGRIILIWTSEKIFLKKWTGVTYFREGFRAGYF